MRAKIFFNAGHCQRDLLRLIAEVQLAAGESGDGVEDPQIGELLLRAHVRRLFARIADAQRVDRDRLALEQLRQIGAAELRRVIDAVAEQDDRSRGVFAETAALGHRGQRVEERRLAERGNCRQRVGDVARSFRKRNQLAGLRFGEDEEREIIAAPPMREQCADRRARCIHLSGQTHRARSVEQDREGHRRVFRFLEHVARHAPAVDEQAHFTASQISDGNAFFAEDGEGDHDVADRHRLFDPGDILGERDTRHHRQTRKKPSRHAVQNACNFSAISFLRCDPHHED